MTTPGPALPANWYLLGRAADLRPGQVRGWTIGEREIVAWRGAEGGALVAMAGHCAHMGCHLAGGSVRGTSLRCPLHYRLIGTDGRFAGDADQPLRQPTHPLREFLGGLFVWLGDPASATDLDALGLSGNPHCHAGEHCFALPWQWLVANGLDIEHLSAVHDRELLDRPQLTTDGDRALTVRYRTRPRGTKLSDRLMARLASDGVHGTIRSLGGSMMLVEARVGRHQTFILMSFIPRGDGGTTIRGITGLRGPDSAANRIAVRVARSLFRAFLAKDLGVLDRIRWHEPAQVDSLGDGFTREVCAFLRRLPDA